MAHLPENDSVGAGCRRFVHSSEHANAEDRGRGTVGGVDPEHKLLRHQGFGDAMLEACR